MKNGWIKTRSVRLEVITLICVKWHYWKKPHFGKTLYYFDRFFFIIVPNKPWGPASGLRVFNKKKSIRSLCRVETFKANLHSCWRTQWRKGRQTKHLPMCKCSQKSMQFSRGGVEVHSEFQQFEKTGVMRKRNPHSPCVPRLFPSFARTSWASGRH